LDLKDIVVAGSNGTKVRTSWSMSSTEGQALRETFGERDVKETSDKELRALREKMSGLELYDGFEPNSTLYLVSGT
jgi:hypothetical protein